VTGAAFAQVDRGIPRKLSTKPGDRFYDAEVIGKLSDKIAVLFNGQELPEVASYDVDEGRVTRRRRREGCYVLDEQGVPTLETLRGEVEVRWKRESVA
jgi:hypothetical protein